MAVHSTTITGGSFVAHAAAEARSLLRRYDEELLRGFDPDEDARFRRDGYRGWYRGAAQHLNQLPLLHDHNPDLRDFQRTLQGTLAILPVRTLLEGAPMARAGLYKVRRFLAVISAALSYTARIEESPHASGGPVPIGETLQRLLPTRKQLQLIESLDIAQKVLQPLFDTAAERDTLAP